MKKGRFYSATTNHYINYWLINGELTYKYDFICERIINFNPKVSSFFTAKDIYKHIEFDIKYNN
jgi:hypothetical protein